MKEKLQIHQQILVENGPADSIFLYIHGIMGSPIEFKKFVEVLPLDCMHAKAILLPGHGQNGKAFAHSNYIDWQNYVNEEVARLVQNYRQVYLMGHSMGGLLALISASKYPVNGILLLNTPIKTRISLPQISISLRVLFANNNHPNPLINAYRDTFSINLSDWWTIPTWAARLLDIDRLVKQTLSIISNIQAPVTIIQSVHDETVNPRSAEILNQNLTKSTSVIIRLNQSIHAYFPPEDLSLINNNIQKMINKKEIKVVKSS